MRLNQRTYSKVVTQSDPDGLTTSFPGMIFAWSVLLTRLFIPGEPPACFGAGCLFDPILTFTPGLTSKSYRKKDQLQLRAFVYGLLTQF